jgi:hypothetical protein
MRCSTGTCAAQLAAKLFCRASTPGKLHNVYTQNSVERRRKANNCEMKHHVSRRWKGEKLHAVAMSASEGMMSFADEKLFPSASLEHIIQFQLKHISSKKETEKLREKSSSFFLFMLLGPTGERAETGPSAILFNALKSSN